MKTKSVTVVPYDPYWPEAFDVIRKELEAILGKMALEIHHVGSISVPGLSAKPIIDIDVEIPSYDLFPQVVAKLEEAGYRHEGNLGIPDREAFCYEHKPHLQKHHLYVCPSDSKELYRHIIFRDYLRSHPKAAQQYGAAKTEAARLCPDSIDDYISHKSACIKTIYCLCGLIK